MTQLIVVSLTSENSSARLRYSPMNSAKPRSFFMIALAVTVIVYSANLLWDNQTLLKKNRNLLEESRSLQRTLELVQARYHVLLAGMENDGNEKTTLRETLDSLKKQNETLIFQIQKIEAQASSVKEEKAYLEEMLINKSKQIEILKSKSEDLDTTETFTANIESTIHEKEDELKKLNEQNKVLQDKLDRLYKTTNDKIHEINVAKIALSETVSTAQRRIEDEWNTVNLGSVTTSASPARQNDIEETEIPREAKTEGHVLAINSEHGFVVIDLGKADNLSSEALLEVRKNGEAIATLSVLEIRDAMAACNIKELQDGQRIEINDPVSILR